MHETKHALVFTCQRLDRFKLQSEGFPFLPNECNFAILGLNRSAAADCCRVELEIDDIEQRISVQFVNLVPRLQSYAIRKRTRLDRQYAHLLRLTTSMGWRMAVFVHGLVHIGRRRKLFLCTTH